MTDPKLHFVECGEVSKLRYNIGDVIIMKCGISSVCQVLLVTPRVVGQKKYAGELNLVEGAEYGDVCSQEKLYTRRKKIYVDENDTQNHYKLVEIGIELTKKHRNAFLAYKEIIDKLMELSIVVKLRVLPRDVNVAETCGYYDNSWANVDFWYVSVEDTRITVNFTENEQLSSDEDFYKYGVNRYVGDNIRYKSWQCLEPTTCAILAIKRLPISRLDEFLHDFNLQKNYIDFEGEQIFIKLADECITIPQIDDDGQVFSVYGQASHVRDFLLYVNEVVGRRIHFAKSFETGKFLVVDRIEMDKTSVSFRQDITVCKKRQEVLIGLISVLLYFVDAPYVILEILDWFKFCSTIKHKEKIDLIFAVKKSVEKIRENRELNEEAKCRRE